MEDLRKYEECYDCGEVRDECTCDRCEDCGELYDDCECGWNIQEEKECIHERGNPNDR